MVRKHSAQLYEGTSTERTAYTPPFGKFAVMYYDTDDAKLYWWNGTSWVEYGSGGGGGGGSSHDPVTVSDTATIDLSLSSQLLSANVIPSGIKLDNLAVPDDNTDLNATTSQHGLLRKLDGNSDHFLDGTGGWSPAGGGGGGGGGNAIDTPPGSPNALDDEFNSTDTSDPMTGWTTLQSPTAHDINSTIPGCYYIKKNSVNDATGCVGIYKPWTPTDGATVTCKVTEAALIGSNYCRCASLFVGEATPGAMYCLNLVQAAGLVIMINTNSVPGIFSGTPYQLTNASYSLTPPFYFRMKYTAAGNVITTYYSKQGIIWTQLYSGAAGFTIGSAGLSIDTQNAGAVPAEAAFDWIRFTS